MVNSSASWSYWALLSAGFAASTAIFAKLRILWRSMGNDHAIGMEPRRAVRIWVRTEQRIARSVQQGSL